MKTDVNKNKKTLKESIAASMDGYDTAIVPFLPYILQDFWTLGTPPERVLYFIQKYCKNYPNLRVLDLGCGKGAVSVKLAAVLKCRCYGIDALPEFIETSKEKAREYDVDALCRFEVGDIREKIDECGQFDVIVLGAIGQAFGNYYTTLTTLANHLTAVGIIVIDDAYIEDSSTFQHPALLHRREVLTQIGQADMELLEEWRGKYSDSSDSTKEMENIAKRCRELKEKYPDQCSLFEEYEQRQADEYHALENEITGSIIVVNKRASV
jgi:ubiquinone/menaquinone biosynthesis C-methylase UbiE